MSKRLELVWVVEHDNLRGSRDIGPRHNDLGLYGKLFEPQLFKKFLREFKVGLLVPCFIMHRHHVARIEITNQVGGDCATDSGVPAHGDEKNVDITQLTCDFGREIMPKVAQVAKGHALQLDSIDRILTEFFTVLSIVPGWQTRDIGVFYLIFAGAFYDPVTFLQRIQKQWPGWAWLTVTMSACALPIE